MWDVDHGIGMDYQYGGVQWGSPETDYLEWSTGFDPPRVWNGENNSEIPLMAYQSTNDLTNGYLESGDTPYFKMFDADSDSLYFYCAPCKNDIPELVAVESISVAKVKHKWLFGFPTFGRLCYNLEYIFNEIPVLITFESNWKKAKDILKNIAEKIGEKSSKAAAKQIKQASKKFLIEEQKVDPEVYTKVGESGVLLTIRYLCIPKDRRDTGHEIWEQILREFEKHQDIELAYPTIRRT